jgi:hypothetical protein
MGTCTACGTAPMLLMGGPPLPHPQRWLRPRVNHGVSVLGARALKLRQSIVRWGPACPCPWNRCPQRGHLPWQSPWEEGEAGACDAAIGAFQCCHVLQWARCGPSMMPVGVIHDSWLMRAAWGRRASEATHTPPDSCGLSGLWRRCDGAAKLGVRRGPPLQNQPPGALPAHAPHAAQHAAALPDRERLQQGSLLGQPEREQWRADQRHATALVRAGWVAGSFACVRWAYVGKRQQVQKFIGVDQYERVVLGCCSWCWSGQGSGWRFRGAWPT